MILSPQFCLTVLKKKIKNHPLIKKHGLYTPSIAAWQHGHLKKMSNIMHGFFKQYNLPDNQISVSTLKKIFRYTYPITDPIEIRKLKTLDKLSVFAGFQDFVVFRNQLEQEISDVIYNACKAEFEIYKGLPNQYDVLTLEKYFTKEGKARQVILGVIERQNKKRWILKEPGKVSNFQIINIEFVSFQKEELILKTQEVWDLIWLSPQTQEIIYTYRANNQQKYILVEENENWKIKANVYPDE